MQDNCRKTKPNIVFIFADDWGRYASAYARHEGEQSVNHLIDTPNFDRIAGEGVIFTNALVPAPSCTPCRSSILAGQYFWQTGLGAILQGARWDQSIPTYPLELEKHGYHIGYTYKVWSPGEPKDAPYGAERTRYQSAGSRFSWNFSRNATKMLGDTSVAEAKQTLYDEVRDNFDEFLASIPDDKPFCYWWGPANTHRQWQQGSGQQLWGLNPDDLEGRLPDFLPDVHEVREDFCDYLGECQAVDAGLGVILRRLEDLGQLDNTLIVVSGDHGIPGFPRGKCNLYDMGCEVALAARWPEHIQPGRVVEDMVNLMDLGPTFCEVAGVPVPETMSGRSLLTLLESPENGQVEPERSFVVMGRERHVAGARAGNLPYPQRAIRTKDFLYIRNFEPDRWPAGDPGGLEELNATTPDYATLRDDTCVVYADMDASPTKAWMIHHRAEESVRPKFEIGFGKRKEVELYDLRIDPDHMRNVATHADYQDIGRELSSRLMQVLFDNDDPRVTETPCRFEHPPFTNVFR